MRHHTPLETATALETDAARAERGPTAGGHESVRYAEALREEAALQRSLALDAAIDAEIARRGA